MSNSGTTLLFVAVAALLIATAPMQLASDQPIARQFDVTSQTNLGYTNLVVSYDAPATALVGTNLTVTATVSVDNLTGSEQYLRDYVMLVILSCGDHMVNGSRGSSAPTLSYLYPGAHWGPLSISIPLTEEDTGLSPGDAANASLDLRLITDVSYDSPGYGLSGYFPLFGDGGATVEIQSLANHSPTSQSAGNAIPLFPSLLLGGGVLLLVLRFAIFRTRPEEDGRS